MDILYIVHFVEFYTFKFSINASTVYLSLSFLLIFMAFLSYSSYVHDEVWPLIPETPCIPYQRNLVAIYRDETKSGAYYTFNEFNR